MTCAGPIALTDEELDEIAWDFLGSEFAGKIYADWPIDRRVDAYLMRLGMANVVNDGFVYNIVLDRVMANVGRALRKGILGSA
jgi:hypothetical protein